MTTDKLGRDKFKKLIAKDYKSKNNSKNNSRQKIPNMNAFLFYKRKETPGD
jgi:hypothetical protein